MGETGRPLPRPPVHGQGFVRVGFGLSWAAWAPCGGQPVKGARLSCSRTRGHEWRELDELNRERISLPLSSAASLKETAGSAVLCTTRSLCPPAGTLMPCTDSQRRPSYRLAFQLTAERDKGLRSASNALSIARP
jgi:hypothetical protein